LYRRRYISTQYTQKPAENTGSPSSERGQIKGRFDNWLVFFVISAILEGVFFDVLTPYVTNRSLPIFRLTPFNLYPTDLFLLPLSLILALFARGKNDTMAKRGSLLVWWWIVCAMGVVVGVLNQTYYLSADIRNFMVRAMLAFSMFRLSLESNIVLVLDRIIRASVVIAAGLVMIRFAVLLGAGSLSIQASGWGTHALLFPYCILIMRILSKEAPFRKSLPSLLIITAGILQAFWKPVVFGFILAPLLTFLLPLYNRQVKVSALKKTERILPAVLLILLFGGLFLSTNYDYYFRMFRYSYLKEGFAIQDYSGNRFTIWAQVIDLWKQNPIFGSGFGSILRGYLFHSGTGTYIYMDQIYVHNLLLQFLYQFGIAGLCIVLVLCVRWYILMSRTMQLVPVMKAGSYAGIVLFCILTLTISFIGEALRYSPAGFLFWAALGLEAAFAVDIMRAQIPAPPFYNR
jgi:O-antigen ligase